MKRTILGLTATLFLAAPAYATDLSFAAVVGGDLGLSSEIGYGNWLTEALYDPSQDILDPDERMLQSFTFFVQGTGELQYRTAVGVMDSNGNLAYDLYTTEWRTLSAGSYALETVIPEGLYLDPNILGPGYILYLVPGGTAPNAYPWTIASTLTNVYAGIVGVSPLMYSSTHQVDLDLPNDRDIAMNVRFTQVPEPSMLLLLGSGLLMFAWTVKRRVARG